MSRKPSKVNQIPESIVKSSRDAKVSTQSEDTLTSEDGYSSDQDIRSFCCGHYSSQHQPHIRHEPKFTSQELNDKIHRLHRFCLVHLQDSYMVHIYRAKGLKLLDEILARGDFSDIKPVQVMSLVWCCLSCLHHFHIRVCAVRKGGILYWSRRKQISKAVRTYENLLLMIHCDLHGCLIHAIVTFLTESRMWDVDSLCFKLIKILFEKTGESEGAVHAILDAAEKTSVEDVRISRQITNVLFQVLGDYQWNDLEYSLIKRLILMYYKSLIPAAEDSYDYAGLKRSLEGCIRNLFSNIPHANLLRSIIVMVKWIHEEEFSEEALLDFGVLLEYASSTYKAQIYSDSLRYDIFPTLMQFIGSEDRLKSLLGIRVLNSMLDRHRNAPHFGTPIIFLNEVHYNVTIGQYNTEDKAFFKKYRELIHVTFLHSIELHSSFVTNLENLYTTLALLTMEIPCGFSAAAIVCLMMAVQEYALGADHVELECRNHLHATVVSIMSLICWVHKAQVFYDYLKIIVKRRGQFAPHLNPPVLPMYEYAQHHILWNKPELFFEDWEVRYGLWKCFRTKRARLQTLAIKAAASMHELL